MEYRLKREDLLINIREWNRFIKRKVHLIACGGTALTLLGIKESTKDVDFMVPNATEYDYLTKILKDIGFKQNGYSWIKQGDVFIWDIYKGNKIHTTELLESPLLEGNHIPYQTIGKIHIGILNVYDLISSKLMRGSGVDFEDCQMLMKAKAADIDIAKLKSRYKEMISFDISEERIKNHLEYLLQRIVEDGK
jgi:hypothetical protein